MARQLRDMIVVITGASSGIGEELARQLHAQGARLVLSARRMDKLNELNTQLGGQHLVVVADVSRTEDCKRLIDETIARLGRIDTLVCNAGYGLYTPVHETPPQQVREMFQTNVFGSSDCIFSAVPHLLKQDLRDGYRGQVMLVSSVAGRRGVPYLGVYSATKAAQLSLAEAMRVELRDSHVAVTSVHPIMTKTSFGRVAEQIGSATLPQDERDWFTQSVDHVARRMVRAIGRPCPEVWPSRPSRWVVVLGALFVRLADLGLLSYARKVRRHNLENRGL